MSGPWGGRAGAVVVHFRQVVAVDIGRRARTHAGTEQWGAEFMTAAGAVDKDEFIQLVFKLIA